MEQIHTIDIGLLRKILEIESNKIVGKTCKRFEIPFEDNLKKSLTKEEVNLIKKEIKELLYEWCRDLRDTINNLVKTNTSIHLDFTSKEGELHGK
jgi:hypothetical protein